MKRRHFAASLALYLLLGAGTTALLYLATGIAPFGGDIFDEDSVAAAAPELGGFLEPFVGLALARVVDVVFGFVTRRFLVATIVVFSLGVCLRQSRRASIIGLVGALLPVVFELALAWPFANSYVGLVLRSLLTPSSYPVASALLTAVTYLIPPFVAGGGVALFNLFPSRASSI